MKVNVSDCKGRLVAFAYLRVPCCSFLSSFTTTTTNELTNLFTTTTNNQPTIQPHTQPFNHLTSYLSTCLNLDATAASLVSIYLYLFSFPSSIHTFLSRGCWSQCPKDNCTCSK
ncbi:hypothetical protein EYC80_005735 [Monilinia laxa]|uniref:Uncharacterized protein n=1 Tax=Monilinia laxa TaxID=61186 RepID=A0A5N6KF49_MONLA|nr:hypothetical protein EYC80_005735 [Monilinia laxa]